MAYIDKLHATEQEYLDLYVWASNHAPRVYFELYCDCLLDWGNPEERIAIANFTAVADRILLWRCPLPFVREYLRTQCGKKTRWYHRIFFKK